MRAQCLKRGWLAALVLAVASCAPAVDQNSEAIDAVTSAAKAYTPPTVTPESHDLGQADIERLMEELSNWGRWGPNDQLGAANLITSAKRLEAVPLVSEGVTVSLAHPRRFQAPRLAERRPRAQASRAQDVSRQARTR